MKYRIAVKSVGNNIEYRPEVLKWPEWLGIWRGISCDGRESHFKNYYSVEQQAYLNIERYKQNQMPDSIVYKYID